MMSVREKLNNQPTTNLMRQYECLVAGCGRKLKTPKNRETHMRKVRKLFGKSLHLFWDNEIGK